MSTTDLAAITLTKGSHPAPPDDCGNPERCLFEWYNWLTRAKHTDSCPPGVSPVLHQFGMRLNDRLPDAKRQELKRFLPNGTDRLAGTAGDGKDETRALIAAHWALHSGARVWLAAAGLDDEVAALDAIPAITSRAALSTALPVIRGIRDRLRAKRATAYADLREKVRVKLAAAAAVAVVAAAAVAAADAVAVVAAVADVVADVAAAAVAAAVVAADAVAVAAADAVVAAAADVVAAVAAAAVAAAVAAAAAVAVADAVADVVADVAAAAVAVAAAAAAAAAARSGTYSQIYKGAYSAARKAVEDKYSPVIADVEDSAIALYDVLITGEWPEAEHNEAGETAL